MRDRLREFSLSPHPDKTRLIEFGRFAAQNREKRGVGQSDAAERAEQHIGHRGEPQAKLVGPHSGS
jgi:hypothetical protein